MVTIVTRSTELNDSVDNLEIQVARRPLTYTEVDTNFLNLASALCSLTATVENSLSALPAISSNGQVNISQLFSQNEENPEIFTLFNREIDSDGKRSVTIGWDSKDSGLALNQDNFTLNVGSSLLVGTSSELTWKGEKLLTQSDVSSAVSDSLTDYLKLTGGILTGNLNINQSGSQSPLRITGITDPAAPTGTSTSASTYRDIQAVRDNGSRVGGIRFQRTLNNSGVKANRWDFYLVDPTDNAKVHSAIYAAMTEEVGAIPCVYSSLPTPTAADSSNRLATTAYVKACLPKGRGSATRPIYLDSDGVAQQISFDLNTISTTIDNALLRSGNNGTNPYTGALVIKRNGATATKGTIPSTTLWDTNILSISADATDTATGNRLFELRHGVDSNAAFSDILSYSANKSSSDYGLLRVGVTHSNNTAWLRFTSNKSVGSIDFATANMVYIGPTLAMRQPLSYTLTGTTTTYKQWNVLQLSDDGDAAANYGTNLRVGAGGNTYIGGGESYDTLLAVNAHDPIADKLTGENLVLCADGNTYLYSNVSAVQSTTGSSTADTRNKQRTALASIPRANLNTNGSFYVRNPVALGSAPAANTYRRIAINDGSTDSMVRSLAFMEGGIQTNKSAWCNIGVGRPDTKEQWIGFRCVATTTERYTQADSLRTNTLRITSTGDAAGTSAGDAGLTVGNISGEHMAIDVNEIIAKKTSTTVSNLYVMQDGGSILIGSASKGVAINNNTAFHPRTTNTINLGASSYLWSTVFAKTSSINTSDERAKAFIAEIPDDILDIWGNFSWCQYKLKDSIDEKGEVNARLHTGIIAQRVQEAFAEKGLDPSKYGFFCHDSWEAVPAVYKNGRVMSPATKAGDAYSIRYSEALAIEAAYQRRRADRLEARIRKLEQTILGG